MEVFNPLKLILREPGRQFDSTFLQQSDFASPFLVRHKKLPADDQVLFGAAQRRLRGFHHGQGSGTSAFHDSGKETYSGVRYNASNEDLMMGAGQRRFRKP